MESHGGSAFKNRPGARGSAVIGYFLAVDAAVATSGIYERSFKRDGRVYHHLMDTRTGYPIDNGVISVSVLVDRKENPDGPPLALLSLGPEAGIALANRLNMAAAMLTADKTVYLSHAARPVFVLTDARYILK
jgi:thiamine biosynthesis lipoprotein